MAIAQQTTIQAYRLQAGGARARMAILRMIAADSTRNFNPSTRLQPGDWRGARHYTLANYAAAYGLADAGRNGREPVLYSHDGPDSLPVRSVRGADEVAPRLIDHEGWFTDTDGTETARGIVAALSHGRYLAGYVWSSNGEHVLFTGEVFTGEDAARDAARMADEHARVFAESAQEDDAKHHEAQRIEGEISDAMRAASRLFALRNHPAHGPDAREELRGLADSIRTLRLDLADTGVEL